MVLEQIFCQFTGSTAQTHCAWRPQLVSKKFLEEEIFVGTNFRELAFDRENRKNFYLAKNFPLYGTLQFVCTIVHRPNSREKHKPEQVNTSR